MERASGDSEENVTNVTDRSFRFFKLPRELRNQIYGYLTQTINLPFVECVECHDRRAAIIGTASEYALPKLRLVSRQYKHEYEEEIFRNARLILLGDINHNDGFEMALSQAQELSGGGVSFQHVTVKLITRSYYHCDEPSFYESLHMKELWLGGLHNRLPLLKTLNLELRAKLDDIEQEIAHKRFSPHLFLKSKLPELSSSSSRATQYSTSLVLINRLCSIHDSALEELGDHRNWEFIDYMYESCPNMQITYRATLTDDVNAWHGLTLESETADGFELDIEFARYEALRKWELHDADHGLGDGGYYWNDDTDESGFLVGCGRESRYYE